MATNKRVFYAVQALAIAECGTNSFTVVHGLQSLGVNTTFNLEQVFEISQLSIYENVENIPDIEATTEKVLDGYCPVYLQATKGASSASLSGRSNVRSTLGLSIYSDVQDAASGTPLSQCTMSGVYPSAISYGVSVDGNATEQVTFVGNNKVWTNTFTSAAFTNADEPLAIAGSGGVNRREDILFGSSASLLPTNIPGISASGTNEIQSDGSYAAHLQSLRVSTNLGRQQLFELGRRGPYHRFVNFPIQVQTEIAVLSSSGDGIEALEESTSNLVNQTIFVKMREGLQLDVGSRNKLSNVTYGGANAGSNGGNATATYTYVNFNDLIVRHPQDPTAALRP